MLEKTAGTEYMKGRPAGVPAPTGPLLGPGFGQTDCKPPRPPLEDQEDWHFAHATSPLNGDRAIPAAVRILAHPSPQIISIGSTRGGGTTPAFAKI